MKKMSLKISLTALLLSLSLGATSCAALGRAIIGGGEPSTTRATTKSVTSQATSSSSAATTEAQTTATTTTAATTTAATTLAPTTAAQTTAAATSASPTTAASSSAATNAAAGLGEATAHRVSLSLPSGWSEFKTIADLSQMFSTPADDPERYAFAGEGPYSYMYIYNVEKAPDFTKIEELAADFKAAEAGSDRDAALAEYIGYGYTEKELNDLLLVVDGKPVSDAQKDYMVEENYLRNYLYTLESDDPEFVLDKYGDLSVNNKTTPYVTYTRGVTDGTPLKYMEVDILVDGQMYLICAWTNEEDFALAEAEIQKVFSSVTFTKK